MKRIKKLTRFVILILLIFIVMISGLFLMDERTIWRFFPGVTSSASTQESCFAMVTIAEAFDEDKLEESDQQQNFAIGLLAMAVTAKSADDALQGTEADSVLTRYTQSVIKCKLLELQGDLNSLQYHLVKIPYKTGNTALMRVVLPYAQNLAGLPEGFMSKESLTEE